MIQNYLSLVKFSHTVFALPFALLGLAWGFYDGGGFSWVQLGLVLACMVTARSAAMAFNRYLDRDIDARNARTATREIPAGVIRPQAVLVFVCLSSALFILSAFLINPLCGWLSPVALLVVLGYSYTKRFTALCHLVLGLGLSLAPVGAYIAVTQQFTWPIVLLAAAVLTWVAGFDVIYALQDEAFDRAQQLHSIPSLLGARRALGVSVALHVCTTALVLAAGYGRGVGLYYWAAATLFVGLLIYQHLLVKPSDISRVNLAFFTTNGVGSVVFGLLGILDAWQLYTLVH